jgi:hypothetical protein
MEPWISSRICEALDQADLARAIASDLEDHALLRATVQLAEDLESFAVSLAARLAEIGDGSGAGKRSPTAADVQPDREGHAAPGLRPCVGRRR